MNIRWILTGALAAALAACGGADTGQPTTTAHPGHGPDGQMGTADPDSAKQLPEGHGGAEGGGDHHHDFPAEMNAFHDVMAPLWHAEPSDARTADTCDAIDDLAARAAALSTAPTPEQVSDAAAWEVGTEELLGAVDELRATCETDRASLQASFEALHDTFHVLVDLLPEGGH